MPEALAAPLEARGRAFRRPRHESAVGREILKAGVAISVASISSA